MVYEIMFTFKKNETLLIDINGKQTKESFEDYLFDIHRCKVAPFEIVVVEVIDLRRSKPNKVHVRDPLFLKGHDYVPEACETMDVNHHEEDEVENFQKCFDFLAHI